MAKSQDEYYYKLKLKSAIASFLENEIGEKHDLGIIPELLTDAMVEAAYSVIQNNKDLYDFMKEQEYLTI